MGIIRNNILDMKDAYASLSRRPLRSILSSLGIGIGVTALITMLSIGEGAKKTALDKIESLGTNTLRIERLNRSVQAHQGSFDNISKGLNRNDGKYLANWLGKRGDVGEYVRKDNVIFSHGQRSIMGTVLGVSSTWFAAEKAQVQSGRQLSVSDSLYQDNVCVIGSNIATSLGVGLSTPILLHNQPSTIVGVFSPKGRLLTEGTGLSSLDFDNTVVLPLTVLQLIAPEKEKDQLDGMVVILNEPGENNLLAIADQVEQILYSQHRGVADYSIVTPLSLLREVRENQKIFSLIMTTIAGLSLLVGGIGVMNVMLADITEQTREIGLRMAVGASKARIACLYLWNSVLLTLTGAMWGMVNGLLLALLIQHYAGWDIAFSSFSLVAAPLSALLTGIFFGLHPAIRAASLQPAAALRNS